MAGFETLERRAAVAENMERLFCLWKKAHHIEESPENTFPICPVCREKPESEEFRDSFCKDGATSLQGTVEDSGQTVDVLFILKESRVGGKAERNDAFWFHTAKDKTRQKYANRFKQALGLWNLPENCKFGYMNLNKRGGFQSTDRKQLAAYVKKYHVFIKRQIELFSPRKILFCGCYDGIANQFFDIPSKWNGIPVEVEVNGRTAAVYSIYHPACPRFGESLRSLKAYGLAAENG